MSDEEETQLERETRAFDRLALAAIKALEASGLDMDGDLNVNVVKLGESYARLNAQVTELQAANTRLLEKRRAVDVHYNVEHFHRVFGVPLPEQPAVPSDDRVRLCVGHVAEEFTELLDAVFEPKTPEIFQIGRALHSLVSSAAIKCDLPAFADACTDLDYEIGR